MPVIVNFHEAKTRFSQLLELAHAGQEIIIAKDGEPYARMLPLQAVTPKRQAGRLKLAIGTELFDSLTEAELGTWELPIHK